MNDLGEYIKPEQFIQDLKAGKEPAFDLLFRGHYKELCRFAWSFVGDYSVAEDIVQELFSTIWRKRECINEEQAIDSYLYVSVRNACFTYLKNKRNSLSVDVLMQEVVLPEIELFSDQPDLQRLWRIIEELPFQCKVIFKLVVLEDLKYREVAERLDVSVNTVKTQMKIAYKNIRSQISREDTILLLLLLKRRFF